MIQLIGVPGMPEVQPGEDLAALTLGALGAAGEALREGDVVVVTSKVVSKAEGRLIRLEDVAPSALAAAWAAEHGKDPRQVEAVLREARRIVRMDRGVLIAETRHGFVCANAGVDASNAGARGLLVLLPEDPDASARRLRAALGAATGADVAVVVSDTFGRPWREGQTNVAIGASGVRAVRPYEGELDPEGYPLRATAIAVADELAGAAELVMHKLSRVPVAVIRGYAYPRPAPGEPDGGAAALVRPRHLDFFR
jgi:coenzyme F420-0:L-glutamate ligase / coenzyme F420-1:gamma-L-glutamate ligase